MAITFNGGLISSSAVCGAEYSCDIAQVEEAIATYVLCVLSGNCVASDKHAATLMKLQLHLTKLKKEVNDVSL